MGPPEFTSSTDPFVAEGWVRSLETIFRYMGLEDAAKVSCAIFQLKDNVALWWEGAEKTARLKREFRNLRQGDMFVAEYVKKFDRGCHFAPLIADNPAEKLQSYRLCHSTKEGFQVGADPEVFTGRGIEEEAILFTDLAVVIGEETVYWTSEVAGTAKPAVKPSGLGKPQGQQASKPAMQLEKPTCQTCRHQHVGKCLLGAEVCYKCKQPSHLSFDCPQLRRPVTGRVYVMQTEEANPDTTLITASITVTTTQDGPSIPDVEVVRDYANIFPDDVIGIPPDREVEFSIELLSDTLPISKAPYRLAPTEMKELKE
ncbi:uncharacterized protein LOC121991469 [Zingiber officinale]|uniref:uncharacterized protein LOC121991469 n=1 Tax=Zingiber officinale TaxID=94328 RepID=UPI001C4B500D|nr:uncharacterized protein LOC121991469 [Zingiber officinale]